MKFDLSCVYDSRQNFYGKAKVEINVLNNMIEKNLYSYGTLVASVCEKKNFVMYMDFGRFSQTTTRHQKEFFKQQGLSDQEIKQLFKDGTLKKEK